MDFTVIKNISADRFKATIDEMVSSDFKYEYTTGDIEQTFHCSPLALSLNPRDDYIKVVTGLEGGWPFLEHVIKTNKFTAMRIRYFKNSLAAFYYWEAGNLIRMQHALRDSRWVWYGKGEIQSWEDVSRYEERIIKNRLTSSMLESYLRSCGYSESVT